MSHPNNPPSRLSPSATLLGVILVLVGVVSLLGIGLLSGAWNNSSPVQSGAIPIQQLTTPTLVAIPTVPETVVPALATPTLEEIIIIAPEVTPYPTFDSAFVPTIAPLTEWVTYTDDLEGFSIRYPQGWLVSVLPLEIRQNSGGYSSSISNYDPASPAIQDLQHHIPPQLFKLDISVDKPGNLPGFPLPPGQTIEEWVGQHSIPSVDTVILAEGVTSIAGVQSYRRVTQASEGFKRITIWFFKDNQLFVLYYWVYPDNLDLANTAEQILASLEFSP